MISRFGALLASRAHGQIIPLCNSVASYSAAAGPKASQTQDGLPVLPTPPAQLSGISASIATLLWQIAAKENVLEKVQDDLQQMVEVFATQPELRHMALDPFVPEKVKVKVMTDLLKDSPAQELTKRLFVSLAEENSLAATLQVANAFDELMLAFKKEVHCTIVTASPLDKMERQLMNEKAQSFVEKGYKLVMQEKVDKKLLGGFVLEFEDRLVDMSVAKRLEEFNNLVFKLETDLRA